MFKGARKRAQVQGKCNLLFYRARRWISIANSMDNILSLLKRNIVDEEISRASVAGTFILVFVA